MAALARQARRALYPGERPVTIHSRAFDPLAILIEHRDRVVGRNELLARVWAGTTVSDSNVAVQVAALRRVLAAPGIDAKAIVNVPGRGSQFVGPVAVRPAEAVADAPAPPPRGAAARALARRWHARELPAASACLVAAVLAGAWLRPAAVGPRREDRLTVAMLPFTSRGAAAAADLAQTYREALDNLPARYGDIRFFSIDDRAAAPSACFGLSGAVTAWASFRTALVRGGMPQ